jgi:YD repeat-containing protein
MSYHLVRRVDPSGVLHHVAGHKVAAGPGFAGDGGPADEARLDRPLGLAVAPDGSVFIADSENHRIRRVRPDGIIETFAGSGVNGQATVDDGDGGPATSASLSYPADVAVGPDGSVFIADAGNNRVRRVSPDGRISTYAGTGRPIPCCSGSPGTEEQIGNRVLATTAEVWTPVGVDVAEDGTLFIAAQSNWRIRKVGTDGTIETVAGAHESVPRCEGCPATQSKVYRPKRVAVGPDGTIYFVEPRNGEPNPADRVRMIRRDGTVVTINRSPTACIDGPGDGKAAALACLSALEGLALDPTGATMYLAQPGTDRVRSVRATFGGFAPGEVQLPSSSGSEVYVFGPTGRHVATRDARTGATRRSFAYDRQGRLVEVRDEHGNVTSFERNTAGVTIVAPGGQRTRIAIDENGYVSSVENPAGEAWTVLARPDGLVDSFRKPRGNASRYFYDALGRVSGTADAAGGTLGLGRTREEFFGTFSSLFGRTTSGLTETAGTTAEGRTTTYFHLRTETEELRRTTFPDGTVATEIRDRDEVREVVRPDGMVYRSVPGPDPRFGMLAPFVRELRSRTPGGLEIVSERNRAVVLSNPADPLSLIAETSSVRTNGRTWTSSYTAGPPRQVVSTSPEGRVSTSTLDDLGRVTRAQTATLAPVTMSYRPDGLLASTTQGEGAEARTVSMTWNARRELASITDPLGRTTSFERDLAGRVTRQVLPDGRGILTSYDANVPVRPSAPLGGRLTSARGDGWLRQASAATRTRDAFQRDGSSSRASSGSMPRASRSSA